MARAGQRLKEFVRRIPDAPAFRALKHRDFRLLWSGACISFTGVQIQGVAQGFLVYEITGDKAMLGLVMFATLAPVSFFGPIFGAFADVWDRRKIMVISSVILACGSAFLAIAATMEFIAYWHIILIAIINGFIMTIENPARQSIVREVVPDEDFRAAVPTMGMTFNLARAAGPAIGGVLTGLVGPASCFWINTVSFAGMIYATLAIKANLKPKYTEPQPMRDLLTEGMLYTFREKALRTLFLLEATTSFFGIFYLALMPAIAKDMLGLGATGLGSAMSSVGIGALIGLFFLVSISHKPYKPLIVRVAMTVFAISMVSMGFVRVPAIAFILFGFMGAATMLQFNSTNTLFQLIAPEKLRGRVLSMHMWAIMGVSPFGILAFGWLSAQHNLSVALWVGGGALCIGATCAWIFRKNVYEPTLETT